MDGWMDGWMDGSIDLRVLRPMDSYISVIDVWTRHRFTNSLELLGPTKHGTKQSWMKGIQIFPILEHIFNIHKLHTCYTHENTTCV